MFERKLSARADAKGKLPFALGMFLVPGVILWIILQSFIASGFGIGLLLLLPVFAVAGLFFLLGIFCMCSVVSNLYVGGEYRLFANSTHIGFSMPSVFEVKQNTSFELTHNEVDHVLKRIKQRQGRKDKNKYYVVAKDGSKLRLNTIGKNDQQEFMEYCATLRLETREEVKADKNQATAKDNLVSSEQ